MSSRRDRSIEVWAPLAKEVALVSQGERRSAQALGNGYFRAPVLPVDSDYLISVDGGEARPDPRSRFQPHGVHGPSRLIDDDFPWDDGAFVPPALCSGLLYELHVGTFTREGTYAAAIERLPQLVELGVTHVELMPLATFPGQRGWGYDGVALFAPHPAYGTPFELKTFVARCHALGIAVLLDVVYNHLGPDGNYLSEFGPYFTSRYRTPWGSALNFDAAHSDGVRRFFFDNARMWLCDYHFDGLRLDAVHAIVDQSAYHFLEELALEVRKLEAELEKPLCLIAESDLNDPRLITGPDGGGYGLDAQWNDDFHHALHSVLTGERTGYYTDFGALSDIARALTDGYVYSGRYSRFRQRRQGRPLGDIPADRLIGYLQNHDQIGNRACGERVAQLMSPGRLRSGAALVFMAPFVPMLFQGEEWAASAPFPYFTDHQDPHLAEAVRRGRVEEFAAFGWAAERIPDPQSDATFRAAVLDWSERAREPHRSVLAWYRALAKLRREHPELQDGARELVQVRYDEALGLLELRRSGFTLQVNFSNDELVVPAPPGTPVLYYPDAPSRRDGEVTLAAEACAIWHAR